MRDRLVPVAVALLCIVAVGLGAAALSSSLDDSDDGSSPPVFEGESDGNESSDSEDAEASGTDAQPQQISEDDECIAGYNQTEVTWVLTALAVGVSIAVFARTQEIMLGAIAFPIVMIPGMFLLVGVFAYLGCPVPGEETATAVADQNVSAETFDEVFEYPEGESDSLVDRVRLAGIFLGFVLFVFSLGIYLKRRGTWDQNSGDKLTTLADTSGGEIATAARDAAEEISAESGSQNGVYRAWVRMTEVLDVEHPETSTPGEFADAALEAGLNQGDVAELTELFEQVRYGTTPVTSAHEQRAEEALRRIEQEHAESLDSDEVSRESGGLSGSADGSGGQ